MSQAIECYRKFVNLAQTHTGRKIKVLRSDRGGEYLSKPFGSDMDNNGVEHQLTTA